MKICHVCLSCFFVDGRLYQENELVIQHIIDGHDVTVIASTETHDSTGSIAYTNEGAYVGVEGANIIRLRYRRWLPGPVMRKLRMHPGLFRLLVDLSPDVILFHGAAGWELLNVARYARYNPSCAFYIDSHTDFVNSAHGWLSRKILHGLYYKIILKHAMRVAGPLLCVSTSVMDFANKIYRIPLNNMEFFPLGGRPLDDSRYLSLRSERRQALGLSDSDILLVQSGKQSRAKNLLESIRAFSSNNDRDLRFFIAGVIQEDVRTEAEALIANDDRIKFIGWQDVDALTSLLCAADIYLQPGTQSATMQHSLCCGCAVILADIPAHKPYKNDNGWFVDNEEQLKSALAEIRRADLAKMGRNSLELARKNLDYRVLARRVLNK